eukprot:2412466-Ditylum_brightwellii.AAC.1
MRKNNNISYRNFAAENNMDPYQDGFPCHLPKLFKIEEMLIVCVYPVIKTYWLKLGTIGYKSPIYPTYLPPQTVLGLCRTYVDHGWA